MTCPRLVSQSTRLWHDLRPSCLPRRTVPWMALAVVLGALAVLGCNGDDTSPIHTATASDLNNRSFAFASGAGPEPAGAIGFPQAQAFTLQLYGSGGTNDGPLTSEH